MSRIAQTFRDYTQPRVAVMLALGFSSGLPFLLVFSTLSAWLTQAGLKRSTIGYFSWVGLAFSLKYLWSPLVDRMPLPLFTRLGQRRGWMLFAQLGVIAGLVAMAQANPAGNVTQMAYLAICVAFAAATQDIALDATRIELTQQATGMGGQMTAAFQMGYRVALIAAGAGALFVAADYGWKAAYLSMAACMSVGIVTTLLIAEPNATGRATAAQEQRVQAFLAANPHLPNWLKNAVAHFIGAVLCPLLDIFNRFGAARAGLMLLFIAVYRASDFTMGVMANPFYLDLGFTLKEIASVSKVFGVAMTMIGVAISGLIIGALGQLRGLLVGLVLVCIANCAFSYMAAHPPGLQGLMLAISLDNIGIGIAGTAFVLYLSGLTSPAYTATQYALLGMAWSLPCKFLAGFSGRIVEAYGYPLFFAYTAALSLPALFLLLMLMRRERVE